MSSPTQRSLKALREAGYEVQVVETFNHYTKRKRDLFGGIDILGIREGETVGVQTTTGTNLQARVKKLITLPEIRLWIQSGERRLVLHGWRKVKPRGQKRAKWKARVLEVRAMGKCRVKVMELEEVF